MRANGDGRPIVAVDIDGTMGDYHKHFLEFASNWFGFAMPDPTQINPGERLHKFMGVPREEYRDCKLAYRQGGLKRWMPAYFEMDQFSQTIRGEDAELVICTTRPYLRLDNIDPDTREWLRRNNIEYDGVIFDPLGDGNKYAELHRQVGHRVACVIDDLPEMCYAARGFWPAVAIRDQPYNQHVKAEKAQFVRVFNAKDMFLFACDAVRQWKMKYGGRDE